MSKEQIDERNELVDLLGDIGHDWDSYICECQENEEQPQLSYEDFHAEAILEAGYRKQIEGHWSRFEVNSSKGYGQVYYQHKECDFNATQLFPSPYHYCPNCGAKMSEGMADKKYISPEDVRKMTQEEVRQNYKEIRDSMKKWQ